MPLYEYKCDGCGDVFELIQRFSDTPLTVHEKCGGPVHKLISRSAFQLKGSGWYITDYAKSGANPASKNESSKSEGDSSAKVAATEGAAKTESTPASKPETASKPATPSPTEK